ncbi:MAG: ATP-binding protein [Deltaproteobacteria bacterium]
MTHDFFRRPGDEKPQTKRRTRPRAAPDTRTGFDFFSPKSIRSKLIISLLFIFFLGYLATLLALVSLSHMQHKIGLIEQFYELNQELLETRRYEKNFLLYGNSQDLTSALDYLEGVRASFGKLRANHSFANLDVHSMLPEQESGLKEYAALLQQLTHPQLDPKQLEITKDNLRQQGHDLTQSILEMDTRARRTIEKQVRRYRDVALLILVSASAFGAVISFFLIRWIIGPLQSIREAAAKIMRGELSTIPLASSCRSSLECTELVDSLNLMLDALETKQNQLIQSAKLAAIGRVTAGIAHEINNPLNNIYLTAEVLLEDLSNLEAEDRQEMVHDILTQADRAREVVHHLLDFSRSRKAAVQEEVDLVKLLRETMVLLRNQIRLGQIHVHTDLPAAPLPVTGNANQLQQVFVNIILNAVQAMDSGGILSLQAREEDGKALIDFTDTGPGVPEEIRAQIFDPFFTTKSDGTGLGLSVSFSIIRAHKGDIVLASDRKTGTTTFRVILPLQSYEGRLPPEMAPASSSTW